MSAEQGLLTSDVNPMQKPNATPIYAALLNAQGRQLHDMFLFRAPGGLLLLAGCTHFKKHSATAL